jgi:beta-mannanase
MVGKQPSVVMWYQDWATPGVREFDPVMMDEVVARGAMPMVTWEPADYTRGVDQPQYALETIIRGDHDEHVRSWARDAAAWGKPFYLRFAHEMNGNWYPWSPGVNGNAGAAEYVAAWRRVHNIFKEEGATNVRWVWNPHVKNRYSTPFGRFYPGAAYVDWVGLDGYNWGTLWRTFPEIFDDSYEEIDALTNKPMMVGETASAESGGNKAAWIRQTFLTDLPASYPQVRAVIWFHDKKEEDWRVNSSAASLEAYREVVGSPLYQGRLP